MGLSGTPPQEGELTVAELAAKIKALRAAHTVTAAPERTAQRQVSAEEPVTARIRRRAEPVPAAEPVVELHAAAAPPDLAPATESTPPATAEPLPPSPAHHISPNGKIPGQRETTHQERVAAGARRKEHQLTMF
jgi:hypothetical protein